MGQRRGDVLSLVGLAVRWSNHTTGYIIGDDDAMTLVTELTAEVDSGRLTGRGVDAVPARTDDVLIDHDFREPATQFGGVYPVRRRVSPVE